MFEFLNQVDAQCFLFLNGLHCTALDQFMYYVSYRWTWVPLYVALVLFIGKQRRLNKDFLLTIGIILLTFAITDMCCGSYLRNWIERPRPTQEASGISGLVHIVNDYRGGKYGFPSCHAANSTMLVVLSYLLFRLRRLTIFLTVWAFLHTYSRIYLGVHYVGDILVGCMIGATAALLTYNVSMRWVNWKRMRYSTTVYWVETVEILTFIGVLAWGVWKTYW